MFFDSLMLPASKLTSENMLTFGQGFVCIAAAGIINTKMLQGLKVEMHLVHLEKQKQILGRALQGLNP